MFKQVLVRWPSKQLIKKYLPKCFSKYPRTRVVIDCTEIKVEKPSAPSSQKVTWSDYKSHNTSKLLVGITPSGAFSFISDLYSGAISDRAITIKSEFPSDIKLQTLAGTTGNNICGFCLAEWFYHCCVAPLNIYVALKGHLLEFHQA